VGGGSEIFFSCVLKRGEGKIMVFVMLWITSTFTFSLQVATNMSISCYASSSSSSSLWRWFLFRLLHEEYRHVITFQDIKTLKAMVTIKNKLKIKITKWRFAEHVSKIDRSLAEKKCFQITFENVKTIWFCILTSTSTTSSRILF